MWPDQSVLDLGPHGSVVEHFLGKEEVAGSIPAVGTTGVDETWINLSIGESCCGKREVCKR